MNGNGTRLRLTGLIVIASLLIIILAMAFIANLLDVSVSPENTSVQQTFPAATELPITEHPTETLTSVSIPSGALTEAPTTAPDVWSALPPVSQDKPGPITNGNRSEYKVALTFDLCQSEGDLAGYDSGIIQVLNETQTHATLFVGGLWMRDHQAETHELAGNPLFELGNHSWSHKDFSAISREDMRQEILLTQQLMFDLLGYQTNLFRLPYGTYSDEALNVINEQGLYIIQWDDVSGDPDPNVTAEAMISWVLQQAQPGSIIIMHANGRGWHTAEALPAIIQSLREQGYELVTVSDLLGLPAYK